MCVINSGYHLRQPKHKKQFKKNNFYKNAVLYYSTWKNVNVRITSLHACINITVFYVYAALIYLMDLNKKYDFSRGHTIVLCYSRNRSPLTRSSRTNSHVEQVIKRNAYTKSNLNKIQELI